MVAVTFRTQLHCVAAALMLALAMLAGPAQAQTAKEWKCTGNPDIPWDVQIKGCTRAIESGRYSGRNLAWAYYNRGNAYKGKGELDNAIADYTNAIRLNPADEFAFVNRGVCHKAKGELDLAIADYNEAIRLDPKDGDAWYDRGNAFKAKGDYAHAIADYTEAIKLNPNDADAYYNRGLAKRESGDVSGGDADIARAREINPKVGGG